jgi:hypothetical protein
MCEEYENIVRKIESYTTGIKYTNKDLAIAGVVIRRPLSKRHKFYPSSVHMGFVVEVSGTGTGLYHSTSVSFGQ